MHRKFATWFGRKLHDPQENLIKHVEEISTCSRAKNLCFYSHYDKEGIIDDYVIFNLNKIREELDADIVFITTSEDIQDSQLQKISHIVREFIVRKNTGRDLGSFQIAFQLLREKIQQYQYLIHANDSVYGPVHSYAPVLDMLNQTAPTVFGITESFEIAHHLQSYFLVFNQPAFRHPTFVRFWSKLNLTHEKMKLVNIGEVGLSRRLSAKGYSLRPLVTYESASALYTQSSTDNAARKLKVTKRSNRNPTHYFYNELIKLGSPFIKVDLFRDNPSQADNLQQFLECFEPTNNFDKTLIVKHLNRLQHCARLATD